MATASANRPVPMVWQPIAFVHLHSARILCEKAVEFEAMYKGSQQSLHPYWAYVTGSVFASTAFLEALINETFERARMKAKGIREDALKNLSSTAIKSMAQVWSSGVDWSNEPLLSQFVTQKESRPVEKWYILNKYQLALYLADKTPYHTLFDKTEKMWQDVRWLKELRNSLTHHKPETIAFPPNADPYEAETKQKEKLLIELRKRNLQSALYPGGTILTYLSSQSAVWAVESSIQLAKEFRDRIAFDPASIPGL